MMTRIFMALLVLGMLASATKIALTLVLIAGLLFKTRLTVGAILTLMAIGLFARYPATAWGLVGVAVLCCWLVGRNMRPPPDPPKGLSPPSAVDP